MSVPKFFDFLSPVLRALQDGRMLNVASLRAQVADAMRISQDDREVKLPSGQQPTYVNRITWASTYLKKAGLLESPRRGQLIITYVGKQAFLDTGDRIDLKYLEKYEGFRQFRHGDGTPPSNHTAHVVATTPGDTPEDMMALAYRDINASLAEDLLSAIMERSPAFFESLVVQLLLKMGYGGALDDAGKVVGKTADEGIDGVIREDKLGFSSIYIQAKRWDVSTTIGRPEIHKFVGALAGQGANKGLFITTARFSKEAMNYASTRSANTSVVLVDGNMLTKLMIENDIGVSTQTTYALKKLDNDFFTEGE